MSWRRTAERLGAVCIYQAVERLEIREHGTRGPAVTEIIEVATR